MAKRSTRPARLAKVREPAPLDRAGTSASNASPFPIVDVGSSAGGLEAIHQVELELQNQELRRIRAELEESLARYTTLYESAPIGYLTLARDGVIRQVNLTGARLLGLERARLVGNRLGHMLAAETRPGFDAFFAQLWEYESRQTCEVALHPEGARPLTLELTGAATEDGQECWVVVSDVSERKRTAEALRFAHARLQRFVDSNIVGVVIATPAGAIIEANDYYLRMVGFTREEFQRGILDWRAITPPEWLPADEQAIEELRARGTCTPYEKEYLRRDGTRVPVLLVDAMLPGPEEQIAAFALDQTERKRTELALRESESRLAEAQELAKLGHWTWDVKTGAVEWSAQVFKIFQLDPRSFTPHIDSILNLSPWPEDHERDKELIRRAMESRQEGSYEQRFLRPDGSVGYYQSTFRGKYDAGGNLVSIVGTVLDVTQQQQADEHIEVQLAELRRWQDVMLGRENRVQELKREVNELCHQVGAPARYPSQESDTAGAAAGKPAS